MNNRGKHGQDRGKHRRAVQVPRQRHVKRRGQGAMQHRLAQRHAKQGLAHGNTVAPAFLVYVVIYRR